MPTFIRTAPNLYNFQGFVFYPGANHVPTKQYEEWKTKHKESFEIFFMLQLKGRPPAMTMENTETKEGKKVEAGTLAEVILKSNETDALRIIEDTLLIKALETALESEKRKKVIAALKKQIEEMKRIPEPEELKGGVKNYPDSKTGNLMDDLGIKHEFVKDK